MSQPQHDGFDLAACRAAFPQLGDGIAYCESAGGSYVAAPVTERLATFTRETQVQPGWSFRTARAARARLDESVSTVARLLGCTDEEVVIGHSTTLNVYLLANALRPLLREGDAVVVTNQDHEANSGAWRRWADTGIEVREWGVDPESGELDPAALDRLLDDRVRLVCFPHVSNVVGSLNPVEDIARRAHEAGAMVCVDGVAYAPHRRMDVQRWGVDFYLFSLYKVYGPHLGAMYVRRDHLERLANQSHHFHADQLAQRLQPGGMQYELVAAAAGIGDYLSSVSVDDDWTAAFDAFAAHEEEIVTPLLGILAEHPRVRLVGRADPGRDARMPTVSFSPERITPVELAERLAEQDIAIGAAHFYAPRVLEAMGLDPARGVARASLVHYTSPDEVTRLLTALDTHL